MAVMVGLVVVLVAVVVVDAMVAVVVVDAMLILKFKIFFDFF